MFSGKENVSILDKTDWRKTIHKALEEAVFSIGKHEEFYSNVRQAVESVKAEYPGWNASGEIDKMVDDVAKKHNALAEQWILEHPEKWASPFDRIPKLYDFLDAMYMEILQRLKDIAGHHRMLLWGIKKLPMGTIGPEGDSDVSGNETDS